MGNPPRNNRLSPIPGRFESVGISRSFLSLLRTVSVGAKLGNDAHLAALAIEYQCELHSNDGEFAALSGLRWVNPLV